MVWTSLDTTVVCLSLSDVHLFEGAHANLFDLFDRTPDRTTK
jgi:hypothetical protein